MREINFLGINSMSGSEVLDRFKKDNVSLSVETEYDRPKSGKSKLSSSSWRLNTDIGLRPCAPQSGAFRPVEFGRSVL